MNHITRHLDQQLQDHFSKSRQIILLLGARQVGKTTLVKRLFPKAQYFSMDNDPMRRNFAAYDVNSYRQFLDPTCTHVVIDEIQLLEDPGRAAKIIYDQLPNVKLIITGSTALHIKNKTAESLAGRKLDYHLYPLTFSEYLFQTRTEDRLKENFLQRIIENKLNTTPHLFDIESTLERTLTYGLYPYLVTHPQENTYLTELSGSAIFKDILELNLIENRAVATDLLKLLAHQVGNLINYSELANKLKIDIRTVRRYISIFEQSYLIFRLYPYTSNRRDEIGKAPKIYFYDLGLRNAIIDDFSTPRLRRDYGALFESFIISEVVKHNQYTGHTFKIAYWRTTQGAEVDLVLHDRQTLIGCEIKTSRGSVSRAFTNRFPQAKTRVITTHNFL